MCTGETVCFTYARRSLMPPQGDINMSVRRDSNLGELDF